MHVANVKHACAATPALCFIFQENPMQYAIFDIWATCVMWNTPFEMLHYNKHQNIDLILHHINFFKKRQQLNNLILAFSIFFPKTHICHSFHSWPSHFFQKRLSTFSFHRLHRCWEVMTLNIDCHHHDHHRHNHQTPFKSWSLLTFCILAATSTLTLCQWKKAGKKHPILSHNYLHFGFTSLSCIQLTTTSKAYKRRLGGWDCATTQDNKQVSIVYTLAPILQPSDMTNGMEKSYFKPTHTAPLAQHMHHYF